jgi:hypothetical protein
VSTIGKIGRVVGVILMIPGAIIWGLSNWLVENRSKPSETRP